MKINKISVLFFLLIMAIIIIIGMGYYIYDSNKQDNIFMQEDSNPILTIDNTLIQEDLVQTPLDNNSLSFSELMNLMYFPKNVRKDNFGIESVSDKIIEFENFSDGDSNKKVMQFCSVTADRDTNEISIIIHDTETSSYKECNVFGIDEEIVSICSYSSDSIELDVTPSVIFFLTLDGNLYRATNNYFGDDMNDLTAEKIENISQVLSIRIVSVADQSPHGEHCCLMASTYDGSYKTIDLYE